MVLYRNLAQFTRGQRQSTTAALRYVAPMMNRPYLRGIVGQLAVLGDRGYKLSQAMEKIGGFSEFEIAQIKVAEDTGKTDSIADALADFFVSKREQGSAIRRAVTIPAVTMVLALVAYGVLGLAVLPKFEKLYEASGKFPMLASFTVNVSEFLFGNWFIFIPLIILAMVFRLKIKDWLWSFPFVQRGFIRLPFIGEIQGMILLGQSFQALSIMTQSGKTLASSYEFLDRMISQIDFKEYFHLIRTNSIAGYGTGDAFYEASATLPVKGEGDRVASIMSATESLGDPSESIQLLAQEYYVVMRDFLATIEKKVMLAGSLCAFIFVSPALIGTARVIMNLSQTIG
jgi:type II secretory pathway component PulF